MMYDNVSADDLHRWPIARWPRKTPETVYIRFGRWSGRSRNHSTGKIELGISVCPARFIDGAIVALDNDACKSIWWAQLRGQGRCAFPVTGRFVGLGSDGEPLLRGVRCLPYAIDYRSMPNLR